MLRELRERILADPITRNQLKEEDGYSPTLNDSQKMNWPG
jgi:hypothetical protein